MLPGPATTANVTGLPDAPPVACSPTAAVVFCGAMGAKVIACVSPATARVPVAELCHSAFSTAPVTAYEP